MYMNRRSPSVSLIIWCSMVLQVLQWPTAIVANDLNAKCNLQNFKLTARPDLNQFKELRKVLLDCEQKVSFGADEQLNDKEKAVNAALMAQKIKELQEGMKTPSNFIPSKDIMQSLNKVSQSKVYQFFSKMPKGGLLQAQEGTIGTLDYLLKLTYDKDVWVCWNMKDSKMRFYMTYYADRVPVSSGTALYGCTWTKMSEMRAKHTNAKVDELFTNTVLMKNLPSDASESEALQFIYNSVVLIKNLVLYQPNWEKYITFMLEQVYNDGVQYVELRTAVLPVYYKNGTKSSRLEPLVAYKNAIDAFKAKHPDFYGAKLIISPLRFMNNDDMTKYIDNFKNLKSAFGSLIAGFDMVGAETPQTTLINKLDTLLKVPTDVNFYLHAGETNWYGTPVDENLIDAVLLRSKRIAGAYSLTKHPVAMELVKNSKICLEMNPISDQAYHRVKDLRNHPLATLLANNYPLVVSSDISLYVGTTVLSHDFYETFLGVSSMHTDLRLVKKLIKNSFEYSSLNESEKKAAMAIWEKKWNAYMSNAVSLLK